MIKRAISLAAQEGHAGIVFASGQEQFDLWGSEEIAWVRDGVHWRVSATEQRGGNANGIDIEGEARARGILKETKGQIVRNKEDLRAIVENVLSHEDGERPDKITDRVWERMQTENAGTSLPRKEGMEASYDTIIPNIANEVLRKLGAGVTVETIAADTPRNGFMISDALRDKAVVDGLPLFSKNKQNSLDNANQSDDDSGNNAWRKNYGFGQKILGLRLGRAFVRLGIPGIDNDNGRIASLVPEWATEGLQSGERSGSDASLDRQETSARAEQERLISAAKEHGFFFDAKSKFIEAITAHKNSGGTEHDAYFVGEAPNIVVIRSTTDSGFGLTSSDSPAQYLKRMAEYNATFPLLQTRVIGVSQNSDGVPVIWTAQSFVPGQFFKNHDLLFEALANKGWEKISGGAFRFRHTETGAVIDDAHFRNVLHIGDKLYPIDVIVKEMPKAGETIKFSRSGGNVGQSAQTGNRDGASFSRNKIVGDSGRSYTPEQQAAMLRTGSVVTHKSVKETVSSLWQDAGKKLAQGIVDQFRPVRDIDANAYTLMRLSKGATGAFEAFMHHGKLSLRDGAFDADPAIKSTMRKAHSN